MTIQVMGVDKLLAKFATGTALADVAVAAAVDEIGGEVLTTARELVPVLTGHLRDSLTYETGRVFTDVVYAGQVEYGGTHNPPEPYMRPAADTANTEAAALAAKAVIDGA
jgi:hypothetical protein